MKDDTLPQCNTLAFPLVLVGYTLLYKLYYHSSLLQSERQACFAVCYAVQHKLLSATSLLEENMRHLALLKMLALGTLVMIVILVLLETCYLVDEAKNQTELIFTHHYLWAEALSKGMLHCLVGGEGECGAAG